MTIKSNFRNEWKTLLSYQKAIEGTEESEIVQRTYKYLRSLHDSKASLIYLKQDGDTIEVVSHTKTYSIKRPDLYNFLKARHQIFKISSTSRYYKSFNSETNIDSYHIVPGRWRNQSIAFLLLGEDKKMDKPELCTILCNEFARSLSFCQNAKSNSPEKADDEQLYAGKSHLFEKSGQNFEIDSSKYKGLVESTKMGVVMIDKDRLFYTNPAVMEMFEYESQQEFFSKDIFEHCSVEGQKHLKALYKQSEKGFEVPEVQNIEFLKKNGTPFISQLVISDIYIKGEKYKQVSFMDMGEIVQVKQKLLYREQLYRSVTETVRDIITIYDRDFNCLFISKAVENTLGYPVEDMYQKKGLDLTHEDDLSEVENLLNKAILDRERRLIYSSRLRTKTGSYLWFEHSMNLEYDEKGEILRFIASARNINERKLTENRLKTLNTQLQVRNDAINQIAILSIANQKGEIIEVNEQFTKLTGFTEEEVIGQPYNIFKSGIHPPAFYENLWSTIKSGNIWRGEICNRDKEGNLIWMLKTIIPFQLNGNSIDRYYCSLSADITNQKDRESQLQKAKDEVETAIKIKEDFLSVMSHELRTPLNSVIGISQLLQKISADEYQEKLISTLKVSAKNLLNLINDILDYSKIEAGKVHVLEQPFRLKRLVENIKNSFESYAVEKGLNFDLLMQSGVPNLIKGDELRLGQILNNLITNAIKYTAFGFVKIKVRTLESEKEKASLIFEIEDSGIGIKENELQIIFNAFEQVRRNQLNALDGTGLGLSIVKNLVALMKGEIKVRSEYMKGTTFEVRIPFQKVENPGELLLDEEGIEEGVNLKNTNILYVEDVYANQFLMRSILENYHASCVIVDAGMNALELCKNRQFDMIIMDIHLPDISGYEAAKRIRKLDHYTTTPIIAFSADTSEVTRKKVAESSMNELLAKPIELEKLDDILRQYLARNVKRNELDLSFFRSAFSNNVVKLKNYLVLISIDIENFRDSMRTFYNAKDYAGILNELHKVEPIVSKFKFEKLLFAIEDFKAQDAFSDQMKFENIMTCSSEFINAVKAIEL
jgi:PAS domain S-box-containing protein